MLGLVGPHQKMLLSAQLRHIDFLESTGKRKSGKTRKGNRHLHSALVRAAHAAANQKDCYLANQYHRLASRRGSKRAAVAVGHSILVIAYHILKNRQPYVDLGHNYYDQRKEAHIIKNSIKRIEALGYKVNLEEISA